MIDPIFLKVLNTCIKDLRKCIERDSHHEHDKHLNLKLAQHVNLEDMEMFRESSHFGDHVKHT